MTALVAGMILLFAIWVFTECSDRDREKKKW